MKNVLFNLFWAAFGITVLPLILILVFTGINYVISLISCWSFSEIQYSSIWGFYTLPIIAAIIGFYVEMQDHWKD